MVNMEVLTEMLEDTSVTETILDNISKIIDSVNPFASRSAIADAKKAFSDIQKIADEKNMIFYVDTGNFEEDAKRIMIEGLNSDPIVDIHNHE